jgi:hypothetical protein
MDSLIKYRGGEDKAGRSTHATELSTATPQAVSQVISGWCLSSRWSTCTHDNETDESKATFPSREETEA